MLDNQEAEERRRIQQQTAHTEALAAIATAVQNLKHDSESHRQGVAEELAQQRQDAALRTQGLEAMVASLATAVADSRRDAEAEWARVARELQEIRRLTSRVACPGHRAHGRRICKSRETL